MNGQTAIPPIAQVNPCVGLLENMLAEARAGHFWTVAVIGITQQGQVVSAFVGGQRGELYVGAALLQKKLLSDIAGEPQQRPSTIIPARMGG